MMEGPQFEEWRVCAGYGGYEVSNLGRVRSSQDGRILSQSWACDNHGKRYRTAGVCQKTTTYVHRLVAAAFLGEAPPGARYVDHIDNDPDNNRPENLRWTTNGANMRNQAVTATKWPGLSFFRGRWLLQLRLDGRFYYRCVYDNFEEAARVRNEKVAARDGPFANLIDLTKVDLAALPEAKPFQRARLVTPKERARELARSKAAWSRTRIACECGAEVCKGYLPAHKLRPAHIAAIAAMAAKKKPEDTVAAPAPLTDDDVDALLADVLAEL